MVFGAEFEDCEAGKDCPVTAESVFSAGGTSGGEDSDWDNYLLLLGGPFAAAVLAKASTATKAAAGDIQVVAGAAATEPVQGDAEVSGTQEPAAGDLLTDNAGNLRLADTQYVIFNVVLFAYVASQFTNKAASGDFGLPEVPATILALTGVSAAGYVAAKVSERSRPGITGARYTAATGALSVTGVNLRPPGLSDLEAQAVTRVLATNPAETVTPQSVTSTALEAQLTTGRASGTFTIKIVTAGNVATHDHTPTVN